jgi:Restriction endonuclease
MDKPPITKTTHVLPFDKLSPADFERLCLWLVEREGYQRPQHLGAAGSDQGRDMIAYKSADVGEQLWYFQCKRYQRVGPKTFIEEIDKYNALVAADPTKRPFGVICVTNARLSATARERIRKHCQLQGYACEFWAETELDERVKKYSEIVNEFFNLASTPTHSAARQALSVRTPVPDFIGRDKEIEELISLLRSGRSVAICGINGLGGIGKTELALKVAEGLRDEFKDQILVEMQGTSDNPLAPEAALEKCIRAFAGGEAKVPEDIESLKTLYLQVLGGTRILILLDNAADSKQIEPLRPPSGCALLGHLTRKVDCSRNADADARTIAAR